MGIFCLFIKRKLKAFYSPYFTESSWTNEKLSKHFFCHFLIMKIKQFLFSSQHAVEYNYVICKHWPENKETAWYATEINRNTSKEGKKVNRKKRLNINNLIGVVIWSRAKTKIKKKQISAMEKSIPRQRPKRQRSWCFDSTRNALRMIHVSIFSRRKTERNKEWMK